MKKLLIVVLLLAAVFVLVKLSIKSPDQSIPSATETTGINGTPEGVSPTAMPQNDVSSTSTEVVAADQISTSFTGYGPGGKIEHGSVKVKESSLKQNGGIFSGTVVFDMATITSDPLKEQLVTHLKSDAFFDVAKFPTATFVVTDATKDQLKGNLTLKGISKVVTLPIEHELASDTYSTTVRVNMKEFGINQTFADDEFVLTVSIK